MRRGLSVLAGVLVCVALAGAGAASAGASSHVAARPAFSASDGNELVGESCSSARACIAVGQYYKKSAIGLAPLAEKWNGHHWTFQRPPDPAGAQETFLTSVSCHPAATCIAVGYYYSRAAAEPVA